MVENQLRDGPAYVAETMARLQARGLDGHESRHAVASAVARRMHGMLSTHTPCEDEAYRASGEGGRAGVPEGARAGAISPGHTSAPEKQRARWRPEPLPPPQPPFQAEKRSLAFSRTAAVRKPKNIMQEVRPMKVIVRLTVRGSRRAQMLEVLQSAACSSGALEDDVRVTFAGPQVEVTFDLPHEDRASAVPRVQRVFEAAARDLCETLEYEFPNPEAPLLLPVGSTIAMVALLVRSRAVRCRLLASGTPVTLRPSSSPSELVEGEVLTVRPQKVWRHGRTDYVSGTVLASQLDVRALNLRPLALHPQGTWDPAQQYWGEPGDPVEECLQPGPTRGTPTALRHGVGAARRLSERQRLRPHLPRRGSTGGRRFAWGPPDHRPAR